MQRSVTSHLVLDVRTPVEMVLAVAVADGAYDRVENLSVRGEAGPLDVREIKAGHGGRLHQAMAPVGRSRPTSGTSGPPAPSWSIAPAG